MSDLRTSYRPIKEPWDNGNQIKKRQAKSKSTYKQIKAAKKAKQRYNWRDSWEKYNWFARHCFPLLKKLDLAAISHERKHIELVYDKPMIFKPKHLTRFINIGNRPNRWKRFLNWLKDPFGIKKRKNSLYWQEHFKDRKRITKI